MRHLMIGLGGLLLGATLALGAQVCVETAAPGPQDVTAVQARIQAQLDQEAREALYTQAREVMEVYLRDADKRAAIRTAAGLPAGG